MSLTLDQAQATQFDGEVKHAYQATGGISKTVKVKRNNGIKTFQFQNMGKGQAQRRSRQTARKLMGIVHTKITVTGVEYEAAELTDIFDDAEVQISERLELAHTIAGAINRREDQEIIDAWDAAVVAKVVATSIGGANSNLNVAKLRRAARLLDDDNVPESDRHFAGSSLGKESLLGETEVTSSDFNSVKALVSGMVDTFLGFKFRWIGTRAEGGLSIAAGDVRSNYAYHGGPMGSTCLGVIMKGAIKATFENTLGSWLSVQDFIAGAGVRDLEGIVEVLSDET